MAWHRCVCVHAGCVLTCRGCSTAFWGSLFTLLLGWLVILVTGCLKMEAVCLTGRAVFRSGLPCGDMHAGIQAPRAWLLCPPVTSTPHGTHGPGGNAKSRPCLLAALSEALIAHLPCSCLLCQLSCCRGRDKEHTSIRDWGT